MQTIMTFFGFERFEAFLLAAPAITLFYLTIILTTLRALAVIINWFQRKEIILSELVFPRNETKREMIVPVLLTLCPILAVLGGGMSLLTAFECEQDGGRDRDCPASVDSAWLAHHHGTQHWWQMMGDILWFIIAGGILCLVVWIAWLLLRSAWRYIIQPPLTALAAYARSFKVKL